MRYLTLLSIVCLFLSLPLQAAETRGLYEAEVTVPEHSTEARTEGMREAMLAVLLKVSGASRVSTDTALAEALKTPARYVQQYSYRSESIPADQRKPDADGKVATSRLLLQVTFDQKGIDELLHSYDYSVWGAARPSTLIWLGVEDSGSRVLVGANDGGLLRELIDKAAQRRALPVKLPLLDLADQSQVHTADVWGEFFDTIKQASARYNAQAILIGRLYPLSAGRWEARWALDYRGKVERWQAQAGQVEPLISGAIDRVADHLALSFAQSFDAGSSEVLLRVDNVHNLKAYRRVLDYLRGVHGVQQVTTETMTADAVDFRLLTVGGKDAVLQVIALGNTLERVAQPAGMASDSTPSAIEMQPQATPQPLPASGDELATPAGAASDSSAAPQGDAVAPGTAGMPTNMPLRSEPEQPELVYRLLP